MRRWYCPLMLLNIAGGDCVEDLGKVQKDEGFCRILQRVEQPLTIWFRAIWWITGQKNCVSALGLKRILGMGSYRTAWSWVHKIRTAMARPGRDRLTGVVEVDESYLGGEKPGKRVRGAEDKALVIVAVEDKADKGIGRIRMAVVPDASARSLTHLSKHPVKKAAHLGQMVGMDMTGLTRRDKIALWSAKIPVLE